MPERKGLFMLDGALRNGAVAEQMLRAKLKAIPGVNVEAALETIFSTHASSPIGLDEVFEQWRYAHKQATFAERYALDGGSWRQQLDEAAEIVARKLTTCAFCGERTNLRNPVRICKACGIPSCPNCLLSISIAESGSIPPTIIQSCRHAPRRTR